MNRTRHSLIVLSLLLGVSPLPFDAQAKAKPKAAAAKTAAAKPAEAPADKPDLAIVAVVGEDAITSYELNTRVRFVIATTQLSDTPEVIARIKPQVLRGLIDEHLQLQAGIKDKIIITDAEVNKAIMGIEAQRNMPQGAIAGMLEAANVPVETFRQQIRAQIIWGRIIGDKVRPQVRVTDEEVRLAASKLVAPEGKRREIQIALITLPIDKPAREGEVKNLSDKLVKEIRGGANFEEVARQFSGASAPEPFWVEPEQLDPLIARGIADVKSGQISDPVRVADGYRIIKIYGVHMVKDEAAQEDAEVMLKEILLRLKPEASSKEASVLLTIGEEVAKHPGTCDEKTVAGIKNMDDVDIEVNYIHKALSELPQGLQIIAQGLKKGDISTPFASAEGMRLYMLCEKKELNAKEADLQRARIMLMQQKLELEAQKYMRNLRREAFVDVRGL
jgi:peptidyl-prolyl cis-trans isomerase SurA